MILVVVVLVVVNTHVHQQIVDNIFFSRLKILLAQQGNDG